MRVEKPRIVISKCIEFDHCRYNGNIISSPIVHKLKDHVEFLPVCPEVEIGLGIPREAVRLIKTKNGIRLVKSLNGNDHTDDMERFTAEFISNLPSIHGFILKSRSPSCGIKDTKIYPGPGKVSSLPDPATGLFGQKVIETFPGVPIEDEGRLTNLKLREYFLTVVFLLYDFDNLERTMKALVGFHTRNKYLFMAYNQSKMKEAGQIVANHDKLDLAEVMFRYKTKLFEIVSRIPRNSNNINVLQHVFGYFSKDLSREEKVNFLNDLELYHGFQLPLIALTSILRSWIERFDNSYLREQTFFKPYPVELISSYDSNKGKMYY